MHSNHVALAIGLSLLAGGADVIGGTVVALWTSRIANRTLLYATAGAAGFMIGVSILDRLPELFRSGESPNAAFWLLGGFMMLYFLESFAGGHPGHFHGHQHDAPDCELDPDAAPGVEELALGTAFIEGHHDHEHTLISKTASYTAQLGLLLHTALDGVAIGAGFSLSLQVGILMFLAVIFHKMPEGFSLASLVLASGRGRTAAFRSVIGLAASTLLGTLFALGMAGLHAGLSNQLVAFATGSFLYISTCGLLPATRREGDRSSPWFVLLGMGLYIVTAHLLAGVGLE
ncbi:MAG TPA: ZIP family metal transporter [Candidatus Xenobia bacterium]|jgi:ZIP family zinc transporter